MGSAQLHVGSNNLQGQGSSCRVPVVGLGWDIALRLRGADHTDGQPQTVMPPTLKCRTSEDACLWHGVYLLVNQRESGAGGEVAEGGEEGGTTRRGPTCQAKVPDVNPVLPNNDSYMRVTSFKLRMPWIGVNAGPFNASGKRLLTSVSVAMHISSSFPGPDVSRT